jgi:RNA polymerase sigma-70 factor (ECF subfamily)
MANLADDLLVERLRSKEPEAVADVYQKFGRLLYAVIFAIVRSAPDTEELLQDTFLRVWNQAPSFHGHHEVLGTWLMRVARNRAIDYVRSSEARMRRRSCEFDQRAYLVLHADLEREVLDADHARELRDKLENLSAAQRTVLEMAYFDDLSQSEIAARTGQPLGTVKSWTRSGLKELRKAVHKSRFDGDRISYNASFAPRA